MTSPALPAIESLRDAYRDGLLADCVPFWLAHGLDSEHDGVLTCLDRDGSVYDDDKSVWFQGRFGWLLATLCTEVEPRGEWLAGARSCVGFLGRHCFEADGRLVNPGHAIEGAWFVMQGGIADCIDCGELRTAERGDKDGDGAFEFWDAWGNPIGFILWPSAVQLPPGSGTRFFSDSRELCPPFTPSTTPTVSLSPTLGMKPLIYSAGRDGEYGFERAGEASNLDAGTVRNNQLYGPNCGNWTLAPWDKSAQPTDGSGAQDVVDNITNLDAEAKR